MRRPIRIQCTFPGMARPFIIPKLAGLLLGVCAAIAGCAKTRPAAPQPEDRPGAIENSAPHAAPGTRGRLTAIGGAIRPENAAVFERFCELATPEESAPRASRSSPSAPRSYPAAAESRTPRVLIATAASGNESAAAASTEKTLRRYAASAVIETIGRETPPADAVARIDRAAAIYFTGGDQARITAKYRPGGIDGPEAAAMRRLLARGGVIAGTSAGDAMMSDPMFLGGRSTEALGIRRPPAVRRDRPATTQQSDASEKSPASNPVPPPPQPDAADDSGAAPRDPPPLGPRLGPGMALVPWAIMDSHFFERDRFGRLVAALEASGHRLGLGVGEDAAIEIDLATGEATALTDAPTLLVDIGSLRRDGLARLGIRTRVLTRGERINLRELLAAQTLATDPTNTVAGPSGVSDFPSNAAEAGRARTRQFFEAIERSNTAIRLRLDGYALIGRAASIARGTINAAAEGAIVDIIASPP